MMTIKWQQLVNNLPAMVYQCWHDAQYTLLAVSEGCLTLTGYSAQQLIEAKQETFGTLIHPEDYARVLQEMNDALLESRPYHCIYRIYTADKTVKWVLDRGRRLPVKQTEGVFEMRTGIIIEYSQYVQQVQGLEKQIHNDNRKLLALYDILEVAAAPNNLVNTLYQILARLLKVMQGSAGAIHLLEPSGERLYLAAHEGLPASFLPQWTSLAVNPKSLSGWVIGHNQPLFIPNIHEDARTVIFSRALRAHLCFGVPIVMNDMAKGVLSIFSEHDGVSVAEEEIELLTSVGEQIGIVVENARLHEQAKQLIVVEERNRLARELHDSVTQSLYSLTLFAEAGRTLAQTGQLREANRYFDDILEVGQQALKEMRLLVHKLRPSVLAQVGLLSALQQRLQAVEVRANITYQLQVSGFLDLLPEIEEALYHIAQEALNNALKHAHASQVVVQLHTRATEYVEMVIEDNGQGYDLQVAQKAGGLGLISMRERVELLGGRIEYQSTMGQGSVVRVQLPLVRQKGLLS